VENDEHLVDLSMWTMSHPRGQRTTEGEITVELPSKAGK
jgi:hypothetical protein